MHRYKFCNIQHWILQLNIICLGRIWILWNSGLQHMQERHEIRWLQDIKKILRLVLSNKTFLIFSRRFVKSLDWIKLVFNHSSTCAIKSAEHQSLHRDYEPWHAVIFHFRKCCCLTPQQFEREYDQSQEEHHNDVVQNQTAPLMFNLIAYHPF